MAYDTQELFEQAQKAIADHNLIFIDEVVVYMPCSVSTFYNHFPKESEELEALKELLIKNKVTVKVEQRSNWRYSESPPLQLALYKLCATPEELKQLQMTHVDHTTGGKSFSLKDMIGFKDAESTPAPEV